MDDDKKTILLLKLGVGFLVFIGILAVVALIVNLTKSGSSLDKSGVTTRRTLSKEVTTTEDSSDVTTDVVTSDTTTSSTTLTTTSKSPETQAPVVNTTKKTTAKTTTTTKRTTTTTQAPSPIPDNDYTVIDSSNSSGQYNSNEWSIVNSINNNRSKKYKVALELRNAAIAVAKKACETGYEDEAYNFYNNNYEYNYMNLQMIYGQNATVSTYLARLNDDSNARSKIINGQLEYIGVGEAVGSTWTCYAVIVAD